MTGFLLKKELHKLAGSVLLLLVLFIPLTRGLIYYIQVGSESKFDRYINQVADGYIDQVKDLPIGKANAILGAEDAKFTRYTVAFTALQAALNRNDTSAYTDEQIKTISKNYNEVVDKQAGLEQVYSRSSALLRANKSSRIGVSVIHERGWTFLRGLYLWDVLLIALLVLFLTSAIAEKQNNMCKILQSTRNGRGKLLCARLWAAVIMAALFTALETACDTAAAYIAEPLAYFARPLQCVDGFLHFPLRLSIGQGLALFDLLKLAAAILLSVAVCLAAHAYLVRRTAG